MMRSSAAVVMEYKRASALELGLAVVKMNVPCLSVLFP